MFKSFKFMALIVLVAISAVLLVACGDNTATPAPVATTAGSSSSGQAATTAASTSGGSFYVLSGASATTVPDTLKTALSTYESQYPGSKAQAYKISSQAGAVKDQLAEAFKKDGWQNVTPNTPDAAGGFVLGFTKNNKGAAAVGFPGIAAGLGQNDLIYIVFLPNS